MKHRIAKYKMLEVVKYSSHTNNVEGTGQIFSILSSLNDDNEIYYSYTIEGTKVTIDESEILGVYKEFQEAEK